MDGGVIPLNTKVEIISVGRLFPLETEFEMTVDIEKSVKDLGVKLVEDCINHVRQFQIEISVQRHVCVDINKVSTS